MKHISTTLMSSIALAAAVSVSCASLAGCTPQTVTQAVQKIDTYLPAVITTADTIAANVADLAPVYAPQIEVGDVTFDVAAKALKALCDSYLANPDASTLAKIQTGINTLLSQASTAVSNMALISNPSPALQKAILALRDLQTGATIVFSLIAPFETKAQLDVLRGTETVRLAQLRPYMDEQRLEAAVVDGGADPATAHVAVDAWFAQLTADGL